MKSTALLLVLLFTAWACTPMSEDPAPEDPKKSERRNEGFGTDRPN